MNMFRKTNLMIGSSMPLFATAGLCSIEAEGSEDAGGGGSTAGEGQPSGESSEELSTEQKLEQEFYDPNEDEGDSGESSEGEEGAATTDGDEEEGDEGGSADDAEESAEPKGGEQKPEAKRSSRAQERFDELTNTARTHEREAEKWKAEAIKLGYVEGADDAPAPEEPDPEKYPYGEHDPEYLKDRGKFDAKVELLQEQAKARFKTEAAALEAKWTKNLAEATDTYPDFDEVVVKGAADKKWECSPVFAVAIKDSEVGPDIAYALAKDPTEASRVAKLSPLEQAREFGRKESEFKSNKRIAELEAEIATLKAGDAEKPKAAPKVVSKAPEPPKRRVSGGGARHETPADTDDFAAFEKRADKVLARQKY